MEDKEKQAARSRLAIIAAAVAMAILGFTVSLVLRETSPPVDLVRLFAQRPGGPVILAGVLLVALSMIMLIFRNQMGSWAARFRRWLADFFPDWKRLSGLPDEKVEPYLTGDFGRKMVVVAAAIDLCVGLCLIGVGLAMNKAL